jgi:hypothetical protein
MKLLRRNVAIGRIPVLAEMLKEVREVLPYYRMQRSLTFQRKYFFLLTRRPLFSDISNNSETNN